MQFRSKLTILFRVTFDVWPWKTIRHLFDFNSSFMRNFVAMCKFIIELRSGKAQNGSKRFNLCYLDLSPLIFTFSMVITCVIGDNSWTFHDTMTRTWWKVWGTDGRTDRRSGTRQADRIVLRAAWSQLEMSASPNNYASKLFRLVRSAKPVPSLDHR